MKALIPYLAQTVVGAPLVASVVIGLCNKHISPKTAHRLGLSMMTLSFLSALYLLTVFYKQGDSLTMPLYSFAKIDGFDLKLGFLIDRLSVIMMSIVTLIAWLVHLYSIAYMHKDPGYQRFFSYIAFFSFAMLVLVMSNNFLQLFFGWEMVGLASYLLIGFWFERDSATRAGLKAFMVNRLGDCGFLIGIAAIAYCCGSLEYAVVFEKTRLGFLVREQAWMPNLIGLALLMGAMAKSAQIPLHVWLPDSMEGPTPVSALIHAATMVTAGVFLIARLSVLFECAPVALNTILILGSLTCLLMGLVALVQNDIKRIIAYSTLSQLGYMMMAMGASAFDAGLFHLLTHACFKALLFLCAGSIILSAHHEQDIWKLGSMRGRMPMTYGTMLIGILALSGFPFFSGFYSKDLILEALGASEQALGPLAYYAGLSGVLITTLYSFRLFFVLFHGKEKGVAASEPHLHESSWMITSPLVILALLSLMIGALVLHAFDPLQSTMEQAFSMGLHGFSQIPFALNLLGMLICYGAYVHYPTVPSTIRKHCAVLYRILWNTWGFDSVYAILFDRLKKASNFCRDCIEQQWIDGLAVNGSASTIQGFSTAIRRLQTGYMDHYVFAITVVFIVLLGAYLWIPL